MSATTCRSNPRLRKLANTVRHVRDKRQRFARLNLRGRGKCMSCTNRKIRHRVTNLMTHSLGRRACSAVFLAYGILVYRRHMTVSNSTNIYAIAAPDTLLAHTLMNSALSLRADSQMIFEALTGFCTCMTSSCSQYWRRPP